MMDDMLSDHRPSVSELNVRKWRLEDTLTREFVLFTDLTQRTKAAHFAWVGSIRQADVVRARFEHTRGMALVRVDRPNKISRA